MSANKNNPKVILVTHGDYPNVLLDDGTVLKLSAYNREKYWVDITPHKELEVFGKEDD